ncbi:MAG: alpha-L-rhamnosidase N-terminal domain-containing protein [Saprospiraceae bacterium]
MRLTTYPTAINTIIFILINSVLISVGAQESKTKTNIQGKEVTNLKHAWGAQWITHPTAPTMEYGVFLYRRTFELTIRPKSFVIYISADNRYRLSVNGKQVSTGPARGDINNWRYETVDIAKYLTQGKNIIAAEVINFGEFRHAAQTSFQTAFILQGHEDNVVNINTKPNENWKIHHDLGYDYTPITSDSVGGYYAAGPGDILYADKHPWNWKQKMFDDSSWATPRAATVEFAVGRGFLFGSTWYLVPRAIPKMTNIPTPITKVVRSEGILLPKNIFTNDKSVTIPAHSTVSILLDQGHHTIGHPELVFSKGKNAKIKITYAESLFYKASKEYSAHGGWKKGHRNEDYDKKEIKGYFDVVYPDGGTNRMYAPIAMRTYRFIQFNITTDKEALVLDNYQGIYTAYPFEELSSFTTTDDTLNKIWDVAWRTLRNSSVETFVDPYYEQLQYIGDSRIQAMVALYVANDDVLMKKAIKSFDDSRLPMGLTASRFPSYIVQVIPTYSLLWIGIMNDFYMYRDDTAYLEQYIPGMLTVLDWFERHIDETGMLGNLEWWNFTDWTAGFDNGIPPGTDDGHSANVSLQYVYAIQNALPIFEHFGKTDEVKKYSKIAKELQISILNHCQSRQSGLIAERPEKDVYSQHSNIWGILTNTFPEEEQSEIMTKILTDTTLIQTSIYFKYYLTRALQKTGLGDQYFPLLKPWKFMLNQGMTTFGETDINPRSDCHGWSATPCFEFIHTIAGIQPLEPGFNRVLIAPNFGPLDKINVEYAHPEGIISVQLTKDKNGQVDGNIRLPNGIDGVFRYNKEEKQLKGKTKICIK